MFIRDCFDALFDRFSRFELYVQNQLVELSDLSSYFGYYVEQMSKNKEVYEGFMVKYDYAKIILFLERFKEWDSESNRPAS